MDRLLLRRVFKSNDTECTFFSRLYIELAKGMEYRLVRENAERVPPSMELALGITQEELVV